MSSSIDWTALSVFIFFFALVTVIGFLASRWQRGGETRYFHVADAGLSGAVRHKQER